jgi:predicted aspartyl protease
MNKLRLVIIPDDEDPGAFIFVDGSIGNQKYRFLLDTGAASSEINYDSYTMNFEKIGVKTSSGAFSSDTLDIIQVPSIKIGPINQENFKIRRQSETSKGNFNLIGMDLLKNYRCYFRFHSESLLLNPQIEDDITLLPLLLGPKNHPYVDVSFNEINIKAVWDTGASITVVDRVFIEDNSHLFQKIGTSIGTDATGASQETPSYLMSSYNIGSHEFPASEVVGVDLSHINSSTEVPMTMILGYTTIQHANWLFDFPARQWVITKVIKKREKD